MHSFKESFRVVNQEISPWEFIYTKLLRLACCNSIASDSEPHSHFTHQAGNKQHMHDLMSHY